MKDGDPVDDYCVLPGIQNMPGHIWKAGEARPLALVVGWTEVPTGGKNLRGKRMSGPQDFTSVFLSHQRGMLPRSLVFVCHDPALHVLRG